jgi:hypothetical protein
VHDADELQSDRVGDYRDQSVLRCEENRHAIGAQSVLLSGLSKFNITPVFILFAVIFLMPELVDLLSLLVLR